MSTYYLSINRNKRSVVLDLSDPADLALARELTRRADILVQNFKPGGLRGSASTTTPCAPQRRIIYCSISGFGSEGLGATLPGYDFWFRRCPA